MEYLKILIPILVICCIGLRLIKRKSNSNPDQLNGLQEKISEQRNRAGSWLEQRNEIAFACQTGEKEKIQAILEQTKSVIEKDELFKIVVGQTYYQRKEPRFANVCETFGLQYVDFFSHNFKRLKKHKGYSPHNLGFKYTATVLSEKEKHDQAVDVCRKAISFQLDDKSKAGYQGHLKRIERKGTASTNPSLAED
ncbi:MAG: hypothetical protein GY866_03445 [Proteobacteria bacterium]|nr:hypothetical protein [Pseudomonadota bacterium]